MIGFDTYFGMGENWLRRGVLAEAEGRWVILFGDRGLIQCNLYQTSHKNLNLQYSRGVQITELISTSWSRFVSRIHFYQERIDDVCV